MGIKGLNKIIKKVAPHIVKEKTITDYVGTKIAIDSSILMYKYRYQAQESKDSHVFGFFQRTCYYLRRGILPVFVFDGTPPTEKQCVLEKRSNHKLRLQEKIDSLRNRSYSTDTDQKIEKLGRQIIYVTKQHRHECKYLLRLLGIPIVDAFGEAEASCAEMQKQNLVQYTLTEDSDALTFGSPTILRSAKKVDTLLEISLSDVLRELGMSYESFVDFCILCGCDYTSTIPKIGPVTALSLVQEHQTLETILNTLPDKYQIPTNFDYLRARELFLGKTDLPPMALCLGEPQWNELHKFLTNELCIPSEEFASLKDKFINSLGEYRKIVGPKRMTEYFSMSWRLLVPP